MSKDTFPVLQSNENVPWAFVAPHERQAQLNHGQSLKRLAERGGLSWCELLFVIEDRDWNDMTEFEDERAARAAVLEALRVWLIDWEMESE